MKRSLNAIPLVLVRLPANIAACGGTHMFEVGYWLAAFQMALACFLAWMNSEASDGPVVIGLILSAVLTVVITHFLARSIDEEE